MVASSAIQILESTPSSLKIANPPYYLAGLLLLVLGGLAAVALRAGQHSGSNRLLAMTVIPILAVAIGIMTSRSVFTFSRQTGEMTLQSTCLWVQWRNQTIRLPQIRAAVVETSKMSRSLALTLQSGEVIRLTGFSSQRGQYGAADAINDFLGAPGTRR